MIAAHKARNVWAAEKAMREKPKRVPKPKPEFAIKLNDPFAEENRRIIAKQPEKAETIPLNIIESEHEDTD